jgi:hypothetical protein
MKPADMTDAQLLAEIALLRSPIYRADSIRFALSRTHREWLVMLVGVATRRRLRI